MRTARVSIEISRPAESLHDFMLDLRYAPEWGELIHKMEWVDDGPHPGARVRLQFWAEGREQVQEVILAEWRRGSRHTMVNDSQPGFHFVVGYDLEPITGGTRVTITAGATGATIWQKLLLPMLRRRHRARIIRTLNRLKLAAEKQR